MTTKRGLRDAIFHLNAMFPLAMIPPELHKAIGATVMEATLAHSLRRAARAGEVEVVYQISDTGLKVAYYRGVPGYKAPDRAKDGPTWYFYSLPDKSIPSGLCTDLAALKAYCEGNLKALWLWTGTHEAPIPVEMEK